MLLIFSMTQRTILHVVKNRHNPKNQKWVVKRERSNDPLSEHRTQENAIEAAVRKAKKKVLGQVKIHRGDNAKIREERTYGKDPEKYLG